jgi:hypothetical protein
VMIVVRWLRWRDDSCAWNDRGRTRREASCEAMGLAAVRTRQSDADGLAWSPSPSPVTCSLNVSAEPFEAPRWEHLSRRSHRLPPGLRIVSVRMSIDHGSPVRIIGMSVDNGVPSHRKSVPSSPANGDISYVSDMSDAAPSAPISPAARSAMQTGNGTLAAAGSPRSPLSSSSIHSPEFHDFTSPAPPGDSASAPVQPLHPSSEQTATELADASAGHSHQKSLATIAHETNAAASVNGQQLEVNAHAPWSAEAAAVAQGAAPHTAGHAPSSPLPTLEESKQLEASDLPSATISGASSLPIDSGNGSGASAAGAPAASSSDAAASARRVSSERRASLARVDRHGNIKMISAEDLSSSNSNAPVDPARAAKEKAKRNKRLALDQEREGKWVKMVSNWSKTVKSKDEKLKRRIRKGIPDSMRGAVWPRLTGAIELLKPPPTSSSAAASSSSSSSSPPSHLPKTGPGVYSRYYTLPSREQDTIARDIARTFPHHVLFRDQNPSGDPAGVGEGIGVGGAGQGKAKGEEREEQSSQGRNSLFNVLKAYSLHDEQVGYCQGMGFPAGLFLMYMTEEEAFWMLHCIARGEKYLLNGLWSPGFPLLFQCFYQHAELLKKHCPKLSAHLLAQEPPIVPELYATHWFMTLFSYNLPFDVVLRVWDILLAEGPKMIFRLAIFFCKALEKDILRERDFAAIMEYLKNIHTSPLMDDPDAVIQGALGIKLTNAELSKLANKYQSQKFKAEQEKQKMAQQQNKK